MCVCGGVWENCSGLVSANGREREVGRAKLTEGKVGVCVYVGEGGRGPRLTKDKFGVCLGMCVGLRSCVS